MTHECGIGSIVYRKVAYIGKTTDEGKYLTKLLNSVHIWDCQPNSQPMAL